MSRLQLYSMATPNGQKASIALEEMELPYDAHTINIGKGEQFSEEFLKINPNSKIPALVDPSGPDGNPLAIMESGAILIYLAEKSGKFLSQDPRLRSETLQWLFFQVGSVGPMFGQFGHFTRYAPEKVPYAIERYTKETKRLLGVLDKHLHGRSYLVGNEYSIADMATAPWVACLSEFYQASGVLELSTYKNVQQWSERVLLRPKTARGRKVCAIS
jgi:GST-like protein